MSWLEGRSVAQMDLLVHVTAYWLAANLAVVSYLVILYSKHRLSERISLSHRGRLAIVGGLRSRERTHLNAPRGI